MARTGQPVKDLTGKRFGHLEVLYRDGHIGNHIAWMVICDCGNKKRMRGGVIKRKGDTPVTCGCRSLDKTLDPPKISSKLTKFLGMKINGWELKDVDYLGNYSVVCIHCGAQSIKTTGNFNTRKNRCKECTGVPPIYFPQDNPRRYTYQDNIYPLFKRWTCMLARCYNPYVTHYEYYGGRGISVSDEWTCPQGLQNYCNWIMTKYPNFRELFEQQYEIDRIDGDGPYSPENCRIISKTENQRNKPIALKAFFRGEERYVVELAEEYGVVPYSTVVARLKRGMSIEDALFTLPHGKDKPQKKTKVNYLGEECFLKDLAREFSLLDYGTIKTRVANGWDVEMALILPLRAKISEAEKYIS